MDYLITKGGIHTKRKGNLYPAICDYDNIVASYVYYHLLFSLIFYFLYILADSVVSIQISKTSFTPCVLTPKATYIAFFTLLKSSFTEQYKQSTYTNG